jgi:hypothetical protein
MMTGCGIKRGVVVGATDEDGVDVAEKPFNEKNLFATIFTRSASILTRRMTCRTCRRFIGSREGGADSGGAGVMMRMKTVNEDL